MIVYRIAKSNHASQIDGSGAAMYPGRWNKRGTPVLYTGESKDIALLETIAHTPPMLVPSLDILTIEIPDGSIMELATDDLPSNWRDYPAPSILAEIGQRWIDEENFIALKVPSCIIFSSHNFILNCHHKDYKMVRVVSQEPFRFDPRLTS